MIARDSSKKLSARARTALRSIKFQFANFCFKSLIRPTEKPTWMMPYRATVKILERMPYQTREGMKIQIDKGSAAQKLSVDDVVDDSIVREIEKDGLIDRIYR
jgi:hypothetical protein